MNDPATSARAPRTLHLPPAGRPSWLGPPDSGLDLLYLGWGRRHFCEDPIPASRHPGWVYFLVRSGSPVLRLATGDERTRPGSVRILGPECVSGWSDAPGATCDILTWVWRSPPRCVGPALRGDACLRIEAAAALRHELQHAHALCRAEVQRPSPLSGAALELARLHADLAIARALHPRPAAPDPTLRLELALRWLAEHPAAPRPTASLCEYLQMSPPTLYRLFHSRLGESVLEHQCRLRMDRARALLAEGRLSVKQIASALGYRHANDFSRAFRKHTGVPPTSAR